MALCAGQYLDISTKSEYVDTIIAKCIDEYKGQRELQEADPTVSLLSDIAFLTLCLEHHVPLRNLRIVEDSGIWVVTILLFNNRHFSNNYDSSILQVVIDSRMEAIIEQMFMRCFRDSCFEQAIGM